MSSSEDRWLLPDGIEEVLPEEARALEKLRRRLLDLLRGWGYELVMPPMIEFLDSLLTGVGQDLDLQTFKLTDQPTGRLMGIRADMTPQVARMDAHFLRQSSPVRLCYLGPVLRARGDGLGASREPLQLGAELFGHAGPESDVEILELAIAVLQAAGLERLHLDLGHTGVVRAMVEPLELDPASQGALFEALQRKSHADVSDCLRDQPVPAATREMLIALVDLHGDGAVLETAHERLGPAGEAVAAALEELAAIAGSLQDRLPSVPLYFDLAELRGYRYHTGMVFSVLCDGAGTAVARGGRYDRIGAAFGRGRPATGFSADLRVLWRTSGANGEPRKVIRAPGGGDPELALAIAGLRAQGEIVVRELPGADPVGDCDRKLVLRNREWRVEPLGREESK
ncbi:MAG: ATP phosphoribosyltransferase regulatory subunit [Gammaproteobacteria bacterium]|nr:ATP phosphoribosyltransferase regulatory subunit [Gammaproteobacteria bacterium]